MPKIKRCQWVSDDLELLLTKQVKCVVCFHQHLIDGSRPDSLNKEIPLTHFFKVTSLLSKYKRCCKKLLWPAGSEDDAAVTMQYPNFCFQIKLLMEKRIIYWDYALLFLKSCLFFSLYCPSYKISRVNESRINRNIQLLVA